MYTLIRRIHLYSAFIIAPFLLMYFVTGGVMILEDVFPRINKETINQKMAIDRDAPDRRTLKDVCERFDIYGELSTKPSSNGRTAYHFFRPGYRAEISFINADSVQLRIHEGTMASVMNDFHRLRGYKGSWTHLAWAFLYDLSCVALIVFAFSGVYLWWKLERNKRTGVIFLIVSTSITAFTILYLYQVC